jgi:hypothetical protein
VVTQGIPSPDKQLSLSVVVRMDGGPGERLHKVYVGIGDRDDNPATKYLRIEHEYRLAGHLDWSARWESADRVELDFFEYSSDESVALAQRRANAKSVAQLLLVRRTGETQFDEVQLGRAP